MQACRCERRLSERDDHSRRGRLTRPRDANSPGTEARDRQITVGARKRLELGSRTPGRQERSGEAGEDPEPPVQSYPIDLEKALTSLLPSNATPTEPRSVCPLAEPGINQLQTASLLTKRCVRALSGLPPTDALHVTLPLASTAPVSLRAALSFAV